MKVGRICSRPAVTVAASAPLSQVAQLMCKERVGAIIVTAVPVTRTLPVGIVTDRDLVRAQLDRAVDLSCMRTEDIMTSNPLQIHEADGVADVISRMQARGVRRAIVVGKDGTAVGVLSTDDLLAHLTLAMVGLAYLVANPRRSAIDQTTFAGAISA